MTSNIGSHLIQQQISEINETNREQILSETSNQVFELMKNNLPPEFLNRIDNIVMFNPLSKSEISEIVKIQFNAVKNIVEKQGIKINISEKAINWLTNNGYEPQFGARPIKRLIQKEILNDLAKSLLSGTIEKESEILIDACICSFLFCL